MDINGGPPDRMPLVASGGPPYGCPADSGWPTSYIVCPVMPLVHQWLANLTYRLSPVCHWWSTSVFFDVHSHWWTTGVMLSGLVVKMADNMGNISTRPIDTQYSKDLISNLKIYQPTLHFTPWSPCH